MPARFPKDLLPLLVPIESVTQHPENPRNGDVDKIVESIQVHGFLAPVIVQASTGHIVAGNHRYQALHALGETRIPVVRQDMSDEQALRYLVADNATSDAAQWDEAAYVALLAQLQDTEQGLLGTAVDEDEFNQKLLALADEGALDDSEGGFGIRMNGIHQVVVEFEDPDDRDTLAAELHERFEGQVREIDL